MTARAVATCPAEPLVATTAGSLPIRPALDMLAPPPPVPDSKWKMVGYATPGGLVAWKATGYDATGAQYGGGGVLDPGSITGSQIL